jgi:hypothetical protein
LHGQSGRHKKIIFRISIRATVSHALATKLAEPGLDSASNPSLSQQRTHIHCDSWGPHADPWGGGKAMATYGDRVGTPCGPSRDPWGPHVDPWGGGKAMATYGDRVGTPCGPRRDPWGPHVDPWRPHGDPWGPTGGPWGPRGTHADHGGRKIVFTTTRISTLIQSSTTQT